MPFARSVYRAFILAIFPFLLSPGLGSRLSIGSITHGDISQLLARKTYARNVKYLDTDPLAREAARASSLLNRANGTAAQLAESTNFVDVGTERYTHVLDALATVNGTWGNEDNLNIGFGQRVQRRAGPMLPHGHYGPVANYQPAYHAYAQPQGWVSNTWQIVQRIGGGVNGDLYKVVKVVDGVRTAEVRALKVAKPGNTQAISQIRNEKNVMRAARRMSCPGLITMIDGIPTVPGYRIDPTSAVVMDLVEGGDFEKWMQRPQDQRCVAKVIQQIGRALHCLHKTGYIHMDFHPGQILLGKPAGNGCPSDVRVIDYGMAALHGQAIPLLPVTAWSCCGQYVDSVVESMGDSLRLKSPQHPGYAKWNRAIDYCSYNYMVQSYGYNSPLNKLNLYCGIMGTPRKIPIYI